MDCIRVPADGCFDSQTSIFGDERSLLEVLKNKSFHDDKLIEKLRIELEEANDTIIKLSNDLEALRDSYGDLKESYGDLASRIKTLAKQF